MKRIEAAKELNGLFNSMEVRKNKLATTYKKIWFDGCNWRLIGAGYDYTV